MMGLSAIAARVVSSAITDHERPEKPQLRAIQRIIIKKAGASNPASADGFGGNLEATARKQRILNRRRHDQTCFDTSEIERVAANAALRPECGRGKSDNGAYRPDELSNARPWRSRERRRPGNAEKFPNLPRSIPRNCRAKPRASDPGAGGLRNMVTACPNAPAAMKTRKIDPASAHWAISRRPRNPTKAATMPKATNSPPSCAMRSAKIRATFLPRK